MSEERDILFELTGLRSGQTYNVEDIPKIQAEAKARGQIPEPSKPEPQPIPPQPDDDEDEADRNKTGVLAHREADE